jgi:integrase/recombinase XerD
MNVSQAAALCLEYHQSNSRQSTVRGYEAILSRFCDQFGDRNLEEITSHEILSFLNHMTEHRAQHTKRTRYAHLSAFFNFIKTTSDDRLQNPCDTPMLRKLFKATPPSHWDIIEKETVDEIIFRTRKLRNRLMLELMARGGMRIGEVLKLTPADVHERKLILRDPKSGKEREFVYLPQKVAERLKEYIRQRNIRFDQPIFPICYEAARAMVKHAGEVVGISLRPHDLRRHAATYASRSGVPIEIVSKVILRHANLSTTQIYLGKVSDMEAMRWIENLYA